MNQKARRADNANPTNRQNLLAFRLDRQTYALPVESIAQMVLMLTMISLPQVDGVVEGVINVHGALVPVVDLRRYLRTRQAPLHQDTPIILARIDGQTVGLIVDEVLDLLGLPADRIVPPAQILPAGLGEAPVLQGLADTPQGLALCIDPHHLFLPQQKEALVRAIEWLAAHRGRERRSCANDGNLQGGKK